MLELWVRCSRKSSWIAVVYVINMLTRALYWPPYVRSSKCKSSSHVFWPQLLMNFFVALHPNLGSSCYRLTNPSTFFPHVYSGFLWHFLLTWQSNECIYNVFMFRIFVHMIWFIRSRVSVSCPQYGCFSQQSQ
jgi:hypothetical protein